MLVQIATLSFGPSLREICRLRLLTNTAKRASSGAKMSVLTNALPRFYFGAGMQTWDFRPRSVAAELLIAWKLGPCELLIKAVQSRVHYCPNPFKRDLALHMGNVGRSCDVSPQSWDRRRKHNLFTISPICLPAGYGDWLSSS